MNKQEKYLGRKIAFKKEFKVQGTFQSHYAAEEWLHQNGYSCGSSDRGSIIAIQKGKYELPEKWRNFDNDDKKLIDGVMESYDRREGSTIIYIFEPRNTQTIQ